MNEAQKRQFIANIERMVLELEQIWNAPTRTGSKDEGLLIDASLLLQQASEKISEVKTN